MNEYAFTLSMYRTRTAYGRHRSAATNQGGKSPVLYPSCAKNDRCALSVQRFNFASRENIPLSNFSLFAVSLSLSRSLLICDAQSNGEHNNFARIHIWHAFKRASMHDRKVREKEKRSNGIKCHLECEFDDAKTRRV